MIELVWNRAWEMAGRREVMRGSREIKTAEAERGGERCCRGRQRARYQSRKVPGDSDRDHTANALFLV